jgi:DNA-3-methyladenine glycosylase
LEFERLDPKIFFNDDSVQVAQNLLGKILCHFTHDHWLCARIIETEAYKMDDKGSHASLGYTEKRKALFMDPGTIYMYYARGGDSFNTSCRGDGNAVLFKSGFPIHIVNSEEFEVMQKLNPLNGSKRPIHRLCNGQTLLCKSLHLKVTDWRAKQYQSGILELRDDGYRPKQILQTKMLGIPKGRDEHLPYRFIDVSYQKFCTKKPNLHDSTIINLNLLRHQ